MSESPDSAVMVHDESASQRLELPSRSIKMLLWNKLPPRFAIELIAIALVSATLIVFFFMFLHPPTSASFHITISDDLVREILGKAWYTCKILYRDLFRPYLSNVAIWLAAITGLWLGLTVLRNKTIDDPKTVEILKEILSAWKSGK